MLCFTFGLIEKLLFLESTKSLSKDLSDDKINLSCSLISSSSFILGLPLIIIIINLYFIKKLQSNDIHILRINKYNLKLMQNKKKNILERSSTNTLAKNSPL